MKRYLIMLFVLAAHNSFAQKIGTFNYSISITKNGSGTVTVNQPQPYTSNTDYSAYWFVKPNGDRYLFINGGKNLGIVILHSHADDTTIAYQDKFRGDQLQLQGTYRGKGFTCYPDNDKGPVHLHYNTFTAGEIEITFAGPVTFAIGSSSTDHLKGEINGAIHLYRDPQYEKSDVAPNCNCDPNIYAYMYNPEIGRTPSACENAVLWRVFNSLQPALSPLLGLNYNGSGKAPDGSLLYRQDKSMVDIGEPLQGTGVCDAGNKQRDVVSINAHKRLFMQSDYKMGFIQATGAGRFSDNKVDVKVMMAKTAKFSDSLMKLVMAKKISPDDANKQVNAYMKAAQSSQPASPDINQAEVYAHLDVSAKVNAQAADIKTAGGQLQHNVPGAAFELYKPSVKDGDGRWTPFTRYIGFGKFNIIKQGDQVKSIVPVFDTNANKLTLFNAIIEIKGGEELVEAATNTINFAAVPAMFNNN